MDREVQRLMRQRFDLLDVIAGQIESTNEAEIGNRVFTMAVEALHALAHECRMEMAEIIDGEPMDVTTIAAMGVNV